MSLFVTFFYALTGAWLIVICTLLALTHLAACESGVKTLAVFFLALWFLTIAPFELLQVIWTELVLLLYHLLCLHNQAFALLIIVTAVAAAFRSAHLSRGEALTVHFEAFCFFADTTCSFLFRSSSGFGMLCLAFLLDIERKIERILVIINFWLRISDVFFEKRHGAHGEVLFGLNELKGFSDGWNGRKAEDSVLRK